MTKANVLGCVTFETLGGFEMVIFVENGNNKTRC